MEQLASALGAAAKELPPVFLWLLCTIPELSSLLGSYLYSHPHKLTTVCRKIHNGVLRALHR
jgi:hypothetical protein